MNGHEIRMWKTFTASPTSVPRRHAHGQHHRHTPPFKHGHSDQLDLVQIDWDGKIVWKFDRAEFVEDPGQKSQWMARQHHDFQREQLHRLLRPGQGKIDSGNTLVLCHKKHCAALHLPTRRWLTMLSTRSRGTATSCGNGTALTARKKWASPAALRPHVPRPQHRGSTLMENAPSNGATGCTSTP